MSIILYISNFSILSCFNHYSKSSKDLSSLSPLTSEGIWSPSTDPDSAASPGPSNVLLSLSLCPCQCCCSALPMLLILALGFPNPSYVQLPNAFLDIQGVALMDMSVVH